MSKHPKAGQPVKIANGQFKGKYFVVVDFLINQFQGKAIERIAKKHPELVEPVKARGFPVDADIVFGRIYPTMQHICLHDKELQVDMKVVEDGDDLPPNVESIAPKKKRKGKKDDPGTAS